MCGVFKVHESSEGLLRVYVAHCPERARKQLFFRVSREVIMEVNFTEPVACCLFHIMKFLWGKAQYINRSVGQGLSWEPFLV